MSVSEQEKDRHFLSRWSQRKRELFANDPLNVVITIASLNRQKGDSDAASWLPPSKSFRCK